MATAVRGRPATRSGPVIAVAFDGIAGAWCDGAFRGDPNVVASAKLAADLSQQIILDGQPLIADSTTIFGALAALASYNPGRAFVTEAPAGVLEFLENSGCSGAENV